MDWKKNNSTRTKKNRKNQKEKKTTESKRIKKNQKKKCFWFNSKDHTLILLFCESKIIHVFLSFQLMMTYFEKVLIWIDLDLTFEGFLLQTNKQTNKQQCRIWMNWTQGKPKLYFEEEEESGEILCNSRRYINKFDQYHLSLIYFNFIYLFIIFI